MLELLPNLHSCHYSSYTSVIVQKYFKFKSSYLQPWLSVGAQQSCRRVKMNSEEVKTQGSWVAQEKNRTEWQEQRQQVWTTHPWLKKTLRAGLCISRPQIVQQENQPRLLLWGSVGEMSRGRKLHNADVTQRRSSHLARSISDTAFICSKINDPGAIKHKHKQEQQCDFCTGWVTFPKLKSSFSYYMH